MPPLPISGATQLLLSIVHTDFDATITGKHSYKPIEVFAFGIWTFNVLLVVGSKG